jgi:hypothetical protein
VINHALEKLNETRTWGVHACVEPYHFSSNGSDDAREEMQFKWLSGENTVMEKSSCGEFIVEGMEACNVPVRALNDCVSVRAEPQ